MTQAERIARNNSIFRDANDRIRARADELATSMTNVPFLCECVREDCRELIPMSLEEYSRIRSEPTHFAHAPGHERDEAQSIKVISRGPRYVVVDKIGSARSLLGEYASRSDNQ